MKMKIKKGRACWVYVLECGDGSYYTGWTNDLAKRVKSHQSGKGGKYTRSRKAKRSRATKKEMAEGKRRRAKIKAGSRHMIITTCTNIC